MPMNRKHPVTYEDCEDIGLGFLPVVEEGEPPPEDEHYTEAARLECDRQLARRGLRVPPIE